MLNLKEVLIGDLQRMSHIIRYSQQPKIRVENVAEHSWYVVLYSLLIAEDLEVRGIAVNGFSLLRRATVHDLDESLTGDIQRTFKHSYPGLTEKIKEATVHIFVNMLDKIGSNRDIVYKDWEEAKNEDIEGSIVRLADFLSVVSYVNQEIRMGNSSMVPILSDVKKWIEITFFNFCEDHKVALRPYYEQVMELL